MNKPHVHAEVIKAWADGAEIETYNKSSGKWVKCYLPSWFDDEKYRVKPEVTHKIGNIYRSCNGTQQMLACSSGSDGFHVVMVAIDGPLRGYRVTDACQVKSLNKLTEEEFNQIAGGNPFDYTFIESND